MKKTPDVTALRNEALRYAAIFGALLLITLYLHWSILSLLFGALTLFCVWYALMVKRGVEKERARYERWRADLPIIPADSLLKQAFPPPAAPVFGKLGLYTFEEDEHYGLFMEINTDPVFVDLREDKMFEARKQYALDLFSHAESLAANFNALLKASREMLEENDVNTIRIQRIGIYANNKGNIRHAMVSLIADDRDDGWLCYLDELTFKELHHNG